MKISFPRIAAVVGLGLVVLLGLRTLRHRAAASRYAAAQERALAACRVYRDEPSHVDADVCRFDAFGPLTFKQFHVAEAQLVEARAALTRHDAVKGGIALAAAARFAHDTDRTVSFSGFAERIVHEVALILEEHGAELDAGVRRAIVADARLESAARPFERERVEGLWLLSQYQHYQFDQDEPAATGALADEMEADEPSFHEMTEATLANDIPRCEQAASRLGPLVGNNAVLGRQCALLAEAVRVRARLDAM